MAENRNSDETIRDYLLGRVLDETVLETIEDKLFGDEDFCSRVALAEDDIINDYVRGRLNGADAESFKATLAANPERRTRVELTEALRERALAQTAANMTARPSLFTAIAALLRQPKYAGAFALLLIAVVGLTIYLTRPSSPDALVELRSIYRQSRPTETRISTFEYAPLNQLRGAPDPAERNRIRRIENTLIEAAEKNPSAQTHHALGVFRLTQKEYAEAIKEFEAALRFADNAKIHNDLGSAHFERAKAEPKEKKLEDLAQSFEEFTKATQLDPNLLEALFNKSLALQEQEMPREAKDSWKLYLQKDASSPWADEARKHLRRLESEQTLLKSDEQVLSDFLNAYGNGDFERAQTIHNETKGLLRSPALALQLSRLYLVARQNGDAAGAAESHAAMTFIGDYERKQHSEFFFLN